MFTFIPQLNPFNKGADKKACDPKTASIGISIAAITFAFGLFTNTINSDSGDTNFWEWLFNSSPSAESIFIGDKSQRLIVNWKGQWLFATGEHADWKNNIAVF